MGASFVKKPGIYPIKGNKLNPLDEITGLSAKGGVFPKGYMGRKGFVATMPGGKKKRYTYEEIRRMKRKLPKGAENWEKEMKKKYPLPGRDQG